MNCIDMKKRVISWLKFRVNYEGKAHKRSFITGYNMGWDAKTKANTKGDKR